MSLFDAKQVLYGSTSTSPRTVLKRLLFIEIYIYIYTYIYIPYWYIKGKIVFPMPMHRTRTLSIELYKNQVLIVLVYNIGIVQEKFLNPNKQSYFICYTQ
jgi:hypothetical protein